MARAPVEGPGPAARRPRGEPRSRRHGHCAPLRSADGCHPSSWCPARSRPRGAIAARTPNRHAPPTPCPPHDRAQAAPAGHTPPAPAAAARSPSGDHRDRIGRQNNPPGRGEYVLRRKIPDRVTPGAVLEELVLGRGILPAVDRPAQTATLRRGWRPAPVRALVRRIAVDQQHRPAMIGTAQRIRAEQRVPRHRRELHRIQSVGPAGWLRPGVRQQPAL